MSPKALAAGKACGARSGRRLLVKYVDISGMPLSDKNMDKD